MSSYIINFTVYTMAMLGLIFFAVFVYKKVTNGDIYKKKNQFLSIEESMSINPRKSILVVRAGNERFLVASDVDRTTLLSKLENKPIQKETFERFENIETEKDTLNSLEIPIFSAEEPALATNTSEHFEPIKEKNPAAAHLKRGIDRREQLKPMNYKATNIVPQYGKDIKKTAATMKEMAARINEL